MAKRTKAILKEFFASGATPTGDQFSELIDSLVDNLPPKKLEIVSGAITVTQRRHTIETEALASTDDLVTINGGADGDEIILTVFDATRNFVLKTTDNIDLSGDVTISLARDAAHLMFLGTTNKWIRINA